MQKLSNTEPRLKKSVAYKGACKIVESKQWKFINTKIFGAHFSILIGQLMKQRKISC